MKHMQKFTAAALAVLLLGSTVVPAFAETAPSAKEEVIYAMADASGKVTDAEAVNIFAGGDIVDYGDYSAVTPLNTNDTITQSGDQITFSSTAGKVYYQGTMKNAALPWNISIRYYLSKHIDIADGTVYPLLRKLKADGLVTTYLQEESGGPPRKYYKLTQLGEDVYNMDRAEYLRFAETVRELLKEDDDHEEN